MLMANVWSQARERGAGCCSESSQRETSSAVKGRVERLVDGRVVYHLKRPRRGVTQFIFEISAFIARLAALIPRPGSHQIRYFGAYSNGSSIRDLI